MILSDLTHSIVSAFSTVKGADGGAYFRKDLNNTGDGTGVDLNIAFSRKGDGGTFVHRIPPSHAPPCAANESRLRGWGT